MAMRRNPEKLVLALLMGAGGLLLASQDLRAQEERKKPAPTDRDAPTEAPDDPLPTMFPHLESDRLWLSGPIRGVGTSSGEDHPELPLARPTPRIGPAMAFRAVEFYLSDA